MLRHLKMAQKLKIIDHTTLIGHIKSCKKYIISSPTIKSRSKLFIQMELFIQHFY